MICKYCGSEIADNSAFCSNCGAKVEAEPVSAPVFEPAPAPAPESAPEAAPETVTYTAPSAPQTAAPAPAVVDNGGFGWGLLGCCIPVVGLVLFLVWKDTKPKTAKSAGIGALVSVGLSVLLYIITIVAGIGFSFL